MGMIQSVICSTVFCMERVLTWTCCAFVLMLLMFTIILFMVYSISVGYHYAQKELASFAMTSRATTPAPSLRSGPEGHSVIRLLAVNRSEDEPPLRPLIEIYKTTSGENVYLDSTRTPVVVLETEKPPEEPALAPHEYEVARKLIGRFKRSRNVTTTVAAETVTYYYSNNNENQSVLVDTKPILLPAVSNLFPAVTNLIAI